MQEGIRGKIAYFFYILMLFRKCNRTLCKADSSSHNLYFLLTANFHNPNV